MCSLLDGGDWSEWELHNDFEREFIDRQVYVSAVSPENDRDVDVSVRGIVIKNIFNNDKGTAEPFCETFLIMFISGENFFI